MTQGRESTQSHVPRWLAVLVRLARRWPFLSFFLLVVLSNVVGSYFNIEYNTRLIVDLYMTPAQKAAFWGPVICSYNSIAYPACLIAITYFLLPLRRCWKALRAGAPVEPERLAAARMLLIKLPVYQVALNLLGWLPGAVYFPLGVSLLGGWENAGAIWLQFGISFTMSALLTTMQTFFLFEAFLVEVFYPDFFRDARPAEVAGSRRLSFGWRVLLLWFAIALVPLLALLVVTLNYTGDRVGHFQALRALALGTTLVGLPFSAFLMWMLGANLLAWLRSHSTATGAIGDGHFDVRVEGKRPDEWGQLSDRFNDMAGALQRGEELRETFGQFLSPDVRDEILERYPGIGGQVEVVTVLFADIRGFTRRSAGLDPAKAVELLNRFLTLSVVAVEEKGGWVNKFLGDGFMALFGAPRPRADHADLALIAARELLARLRELNGELERDGEAPVVVGIGIHAGPALVGCIGATLPGPEGARRVRREFTAIGETVNLAQRLEQLTKVHGGPILLSDAVVQLLRSPEPITPIGPVDVPGYDGKLIAYRAGA